jgi:hypothetical protein
MKNIKWESQAISFPQKLLFSLFSLCLTCLHCWVPPKSQTHSIPYLDLEEIWINKQIFLCAVVERVLEEEFKNLGSGRVSVAHTQLLQRWRLGGLRLEASLAKIYQDPISSNNWVLWYMHVIPAMQEDGDPGQLEHKCKIYLKNNWNKKVSSGRVPA